MRKRRICFVTGTRAEFGLMRTTLEAIRDHRTLELQLVVTGMHLSRAHGKSIDRIRKEGWHIDAVVPWKSDVPTGAAVGNATAKLSAAYQKLKPDIVLLCGDRVEPFAAASAAHLDGIAIAHVHGGDRAMGQVDDALRHAITKLSHIHLCATKQSADRVYKLGEEELRIHVVGAPGIDDLKSLAAEHPHDGLDALLILHPESADEKSEYANAIKLIDSARKAGAKSIVIVNSNNDPGWRGIDKARKSIRGDDIKLAGDLPRGAFAGLLQSARVLVGNSSAGIIEAATLGTPVVNIGRRQQGRERSANVIDVPWSKAKITETIRTILRSGKRYHGPNIYGGGSAGAKIASILADVSVRSELRHKLIRY